MSISRKQKFILLKMLEHDNEELYGIIAPRIAMGHSFPDVLFADYADEFRLNVTQAHKELMYNMRSLEKNFMIESQRHVWFEYFGHCSVWRIRNDDVRDWIRTFCKF